MSIMFGTKSRVQKVVRSRPAKFVLDARWTVRLVALLVFVNGLLSVSQPMLLHFRRHAHALGWATPFGVHYWSGTLSLLIGLALIYLAYNLLGRRRTAWYLATAGSALVALVHLARVHYWYLAIVPALTAVELLRVRKLYSVRSEPASLRRGVLLLCLSAAAVIAYGTLGFWLIDPRAFGLNFRLVNALAHTLQHFTLTGNADLKPRDDEAQWFLYSLNVVGWAAGAFGIYSIFRPLAYRYHTLPEERDAASRILAAYGASPMDYFKLFPEKSYFFAHDCVIAYRVAHRVALSMGDPVGPCDKLEAATRDFLEYSDIHGWRAALTHVLPDLLPMYRRLGLQHVLIGEEAVVDLDHFASETSNNKEFRRLRRKFGEGGYTFEYRPPRQPRALLDEVEQVSREWLSIPGRRERNFTLGYFDRAYIAGCGLFLLRGPEGKLIAFANEIPSYRAGEATVDLMRHGVDTPNGTMDYLLMSVMLYLHANGCKRFNLGLAPLSGVGEHPDAVLEERVLAQAFDHLNRFFSYKGLYRYKSKFNPEWEPRFLVYQGGPAGLVQTGMALSRLTEKK